MLRSLFGKNSNQKNKIVVCITSGTVSSALVSFGESGRPKIIEQSETFLPIRARVEAKTLMQNVKNALEKTLKQINKNTKVKYSEIDVICASPWFNARTREVQYEKSNAFSVSERLIREIGIAESKKIRSDLDANAVLIEERVAHIRLNGYECDDPIGKKTKKMSLSLFASFVPKDFIEQVTQTVRMAMPAKKITFHSMPFVGFHVLSRIWRNDKQFAFLYVGAEVSDFLLVDGGAIIETLSFPVGTNHLVRSIAADQDISKELALSSLMSLSRGSVGISIVKRLERGIAPIKEEWLAYVNQSVRETLPDHHSVQKIYLSAEENTFNLWASILSSHVQKLLTIDEGAIAQFVEHSPAVKPNSLIAMSAVYLGRGD